MSAATDTVTVERTFCFVGLAGFTALTEAHGDTEAIALLDEFLALTRQALSPGDDLVKTIGDAVMLTSPSPERALGALGRIMTSCQTTNGFPLPQAGAHHGSAIARGGDYLGGAVNLAARVAGHACGGQLLVTSATVRTARQFHFDVVALGPHHLRNVFEPIELFEVRVGQPETSYTVDPVCRMKIDREQAAGSLRHHGREYWFCSLNCVSAFCDNPNHAVNKHITTQMTTVREARHQVYRSHLPAAASRAESRSATPGGGSGEVSRTAPRRSAGTQNQGTCSSGSSRREAPTRATHASRRDNSSRDGARPECCLVWSSLGRVPASWLSTAGTGPDQLAEPARLDAQLGGI